MLSAAAAASPQTVAASHLPITACAPGAGSQGARTPRWGAPAPRGRGAACRAHGAGLPLPGVCPRARQGLSGAPCGGHSALVFFPVQARGGC